MLQKLLKYINFLNLLVGSSFSICFMLQFPIYININKVSIKFQIATLAEKKIIFLIYNWLIKYFFYINLYYSEIYINCYFILILSYQK